MLTNIPEVWIHCYQNSNYAVSNHGRVMRTTPFSSTFVGRVLSTKTPSSKGYCRVLLYKDGVRVNYQVHRLVASNFMKMEYSDDKVVHHKDSNPLNNAVWNLECTTHQGNQIMAYKAGKHTACIGAKGSKHQMAKLSETDIPIIRNRFEEGESCSCIAKDYPVGSSMIHLIVCRKAWRHV